MKTSDLFIKALENEGVEYILLISGKKLSVRKIGIPLNTNSRF